MACPRIRISAALALFAIAVRTGAQDKPETALMIFDAYLAKAAIQNPIYRTDLKAGADPGPPQAGRLTASSPLIGPFTYRPKTFAELSRQERSALLYDPSFRSFLATIRVPGTASEPADTFSVTPEEMLRNRPVCVSASP